MSRRVYGFVLVGWLCAAGAAYLALFERDATDDYAGWIPAVVGVQVPALLALHPPRWPAPLSSVRRWSLALPAALAAGFGAFWLVLPLGTFLWKPAFLELRPALLALGAGVVALIAAGVAFPRTLRTLDHPHGTRRMLLAVTAAGALGLVAMLLRFGGVESWHELGVWLVVAVPLLWTVPFWLLVAIRPPAEPQIPRVIVAR